MIATRGDGVRLQLTRESERFTSAPRRVLIYSRGERRAVVWRSDQTLMGRRGRPYTLADRAAKLGLRVEDEPHGAGAGITLHTRLPRGTAALPGHGRRGARLPGQLLGRRRPVPASGGVDRDRAAAVVVDEEPRMSADRDLWRNAKGHEVLWRLVYHPGDLATASNPARYAQRHPALAHLPPCTPRKGPSRRLPA